METRADKATTRQYIDKIVEAQSLIREDKKRREFWKAYHDGIKHARYGHLSEEKVLAYKENTDKEIRIAFQKGLDVLFNQTKPTR